MSEKVKCNSCQKAYLEAGSEGVYIGGYRGNMDEKIHVCYNCFKDKERDYLRNYSSIYTYDKDWNRRKGSGYLKGDNKDCYFDQKDQDGKVLKQSNCQCCNWKYDENIPNTTKICSACRKNISSQQITYSTKSSEEEKLFCSVECMVPQHEMPKKDSENKVMPVETKVFLGILVILILIISIALGKIWQKNKNNKK